MEVQLFKLDSKIPVSSSQLAVLEEEASMIKGMIRKTLLQFDEMVKSIEGPFQTCRNDFPESVNESKGDSPQDHDQDAFDDVGPANSSEHGSECTR